jgi:hypothetical protein
MSTCGLLALAASVHCGAAEPAVSGKDFRIEFD